jgi:hypothetical protein
MNSSAPQIGFDRFIQLDWVSTALRIRAGTAELDDLNVLLDAADLGKEAKAKTRTKLNALGLQPRQDLAEFADRGVGLLRNEPSIPFAALAWGMAISTYPFFGKVAEITGRLTSIQGDCSSMEIHRRISEIFGDREVTKRATQAVLQTQANWGLIQRVDNGKRLIRLAPIRILDDALAAWLLEGALRYSGKAMPVATLQSIAAVYPFTLDQSLAHVLSSNPTLELRADGPSNRILSLREIN